MKKPMASVEMVRNLKDVSMKSIVKILSLAGMLLLGSCSKDTSAPAIEKITDPKLRNDGPTARFSGSVGLDGARAIEHALNETTTEVLMEKDFDEVAYEAAVANGGWVEMKDYNRDRAVRQRKNRKLELSLVGRSTQVLCVIKSDNPAQPTTYAYMPVLTGDNKRFELDTSVDVSLAAGTDLTQGNWSITGFVYSSGKSSGQIIAFDETTKRLEIKAPNSSFVATEYDASSATGSKFTPPTLYMFDWVPLVVETIAKPTGGVEVRAKMSTRAKLKPQGALFVQEISNDALLSLPREEDLKWYLGDPWDATTPPLPAHPEYKDASGNPLYMHYRGMSVNMLNEEGTPSGALDGYYDLSASALLTSQSPELRMGTTHRLELRHPEIRYYHNERYEEKSRYWASLLMVPTSGSDAGLGASVTLDNLLPAYPGSYMPYAYHRGLVNTGGPHVIGPAFFSRVAYLTWGFSGKPKHGSIIHRQILGGAYMAPGVW